MPENAALRAVARIPMANPDAMLCKLCQHFVKHGKVTLEEKRGRIESPFGVAHLEAGANELMIRADCPDEIALSVVKSTLAEHLFAFSGNDAASFVWMGDQPSTTGIPYFHEAVVVSAHNITRRMRRVTLAGVDLRRFERGRLHVRILIPPKGMRPTWPELALDGRILWPKGEAALIPRVYTIRSIDRLRGTIDIDVVLHGGHRTPGATWAAEARPGDPVGLMGPGGGDVPDAQHLLMIGDETALPAIARTLEALPAGRRATVHLEVADRDEEQALQSDAEVAWHWIHRNGVEPGTSGALAEAVRRFGWSATRHGIYVLAGCEHIDARAIRTFLRKDIALERERHLVAAYWRRGFD